MSKSKVLKHLILNKPSISNFNKNFNLEKTKTKHSLNRTTPWTTVNLKKYKILLEYRISYYREMHVYLTIVHVTTDDALHIWLVLFALPIVMPVCF